MKREAEKVAAADQVYTNAFSNLKDAYKRATTNSDSHRAATTTGLSAPPSLDDVPLVWLQEVWEPGELEVHRDSDLSRQIAIPTPSQRDEPQQELDCEEEEMGA